MKSIINQHGDISSPSECFAAESFPRAVNIVLTNKCNYKCKFCFGKYNFLEHWPDDSNLDSLLSILSKIGVEKVTFEGGEPFTYSKLFHYISVAKKVGLTTSIISNGSLITEDTIKRISPDLDWLGLSIDSGSNQIEKELGRGFGNHVSHIKKVARWAHIHGIKLKINVVVNRLNFKEDMSMLLRSLNPSRIKMFQCLEMIGDNDAELLHLSIDDREFKEFISRHIHLRDYGFNIIYEENRHMIDSYLMILPDGRLLSNHDGAYKSTKGNLFNDKPVNLLDEIQWNKEAYIFRGGEYKW